MDRNERVAVGAELFLGIKNLAIARHS